MAIVFPFFAIHKKKGTTFIPFYFVSIPFSSFRCKFWSIYSILHLIRVNNLMSTTEVRGEKKSAKIVRATVRSFCFCESFEFQSNTYLRIIIVFCFDSFRMKLKQNQLHIFASDSIFWWKDKNQRKKKKIKTEKLIYYRELKRNRNLFFLERTINNGRKFSSGCLIIIFLFQQNHWLPPVPPTRCFDWFVRFTVFAFEFCFHLLFCLKFNKGENLWTLI